MKISVRFITLRAEKVMEKIEFKVLRGNPIRRQSYDAKKNPRPPILGHPGFSLQKAQALPFVAAGFKDIDYKDINTLV